MPLIDRRASYDTSRHISTFLAWPSISLVTNGFSSCQSLLPPVREGVPMPHVLRSVCSWISDGGIHYAPALLYVRRGPTVRAARRPRSSRPAKCRSSHAHLTRGVSIGLLASGCTRTTGRSSDAARKARGTRPCLSASRPEGMANPRTQSFSAAGSSTTNRASLRKARPALRGSVERGNTKVDGLRVCAHPCRRSNSSAACESKSATQRITKMATSTYADGSRPDGPVWDADTDALFRSACLF